MSQPTQIVPKLWNYCNVLLDDGMSYGDYVEQLTYLLFLKMADERTKAVDHRTIGGNDVCPSGCGKTFKECGGASM